MEQSKYFKCEVEQIPRSQIRFAEYNPRGMELDAQKRLKRGLKKYGMVEPIVLNKRTGYTIVGGHQRVTILDELHKYPQNDYILLASVVDVDEKEEKEINLLLNNQEAQGYWDYDKLAQIVPDIDWKSAGLTNADLNMIGVEYLLQTKEEIEIANELAQIDVPLAEQREEERVQRQIQREQEKLASQPQDTEKQEDKYERNKEHLMKEKKSIGEEIVDEVHEMQAYIMLSFDTYEAKARFMERFGYDANEKFIKGEVFDNQVERIE